ncbi:hypothetical protein [Candidatus Sororendozoicomonas aggregata]|uniref:hypothetical protein n=1 Tax=Candidatus Sororendozoicomonas aggregata TaxID=3073239 RepID=UPI002ED2BEC7
MEWDWRGRLMWRVGAGFLAPADSWGKTVRLTNYSIAFSGYRNEHGKLNGGNEGQVFRLSAQ